MAVFFLKQKPAYEVRISDWSSDVCSSDLMQQNTALAVGTVILLLTGVLLGKIFLASGMLVHELSVLLVTLNAVRLIRYRVSGAFDEPIPADAMRFARTDL